MNREQLIEAFTMKVCGYKTTDIAKYFGVKPSTLQSALQRVITGKVLCPSIYPKVNEFMLEKGYAISDMSDRMEIPNSTCRDFLIGKTKSYEMIVKLLKITGLTFEEIFLSETVEVSGYDD